MHELCNNKNRMCYNENTKRVLNDQGRSGYAKEGANEKSNLGFTDGMSVLRSVF